jgi:DNA-directed RNA polymerase subunit M/transcription elongation factor TFIIS
MARIRICPKCKKALVKSAVNVSGWLAPNMFKCDKCGYMGYFYIEIDPEDFELEEELESEEKGNT